MSTPTYTGKRLNVAGSYVLVRGCPGLSMPEAQDLLRAATGLDFPEDHISLDNDGFMVALPLDAVGHLLNDSFAKLGDKDDLCPRVKFRDPHRMKSMVKKYEAFVPPAEWLST